MALTCLGAALQPTCVTAQSELPYTVTTIAGKPATGAVDGHGTAASFVTPMGLAVDTHGNTYISDYGNNTIRKISSSGDVSTLAGSTGGSDDGVGVTGKFRGPLGVSVDSNGNVYVADSGNCTIRKITPDGRVSTFAGTPGAAGSTDGIGAAARFQSPTGVVVTSSGVVYVSDFNSTIRRIDPSGSVTTIAGTAGMEGTADGTGSAARFSTPAQLALDKDGNLLVADRGNGKIRKITAAGVVTTLPDLTVDGWSMFVTWGVAADATGNVYAADYILGTIRKIDPAGNVSVYAGVLTIGGDTDGGPSIARFSSPSEIAMDQDGNLFVADSYNSQIRKISSARDVTTIAGTKGSAGTADGPGTDARFLRPSGIALAQDGNIYVADAGNATIRKITSAGVVSTFAGTVQSRDTVDGTGTNAKFSELYALTTDRNGTLYVADGVAIRKVTPTGVTTTLAVASYGYGSYLNSPVGVAVDGSGNVFVTDSNNYTVVKISPSGAISELAGSNRQQGFVDGQGGSARFQNPEGLAIDSQGNLYVADFQLRKVTPAGVVTTITHFSDNDPGVRGTLAIDAAGYIYGVNNGALIRIAPSGEWILLAGSIDTLGSADGLGRMARFNGYESGVAIDAAGNLFIADQNNNTIRKAIPPVAPAIAAHPSSQKLESGATLTLSVTASGTPPPTYQWFKDGKAIGNATSATYTVSNATAADAGVYTAVATNAVGSVTSQSATVSVTIRSSRLANISTRAFCGTGGNVTIGGFVITGSGPRKVLLRAVGPTLSSLGIDQSRVLADPTLEVHDAVHSNAVIASNDNWADNANASEITSVAAQIGANVFAASDTKSSALLLSLQPGVYTMVAAGKSGGSGVVLIEAYDADLGTNGSSFVNIASRAFATTGDGVTIGGFVVTGNISKQVLLRAVGPTLSKQGIAQAELLADPTIELHDASHGNAVVATNDNWTDNANAASITTTSARIGAAPFDAADTKSSALLMTLEPGVYTFIASGKASASGIVLVEVYDAD